MAMEEIRKYPVGMQTFSDIREGNYVYVYTCPAGKPLVQFMRDAKSIVRSEAQKK